MPTIEEKRVYAEQTGTTEVYVASEVGVVLVLVSGDIAGEFSIAHRCTARDVATDANNVAVATDEDVLVLRDGEFEPADFGSAVAVGYTEGSLVAAAPDGTVARRTDDDWTGLGTVEDVRAIDGRMLAAADGVYRIGDELHHTGLDDVRDVAAAGVPLAATPEALYKLGNGWMDVLDGDFRLVSSNGVRAHAATPDALYARDHDADDSWHETSLPVAERIDALADVAGLSVAVTESGTLLVESETAGSGDGAGDDTEDVWRTRSLGVRDIGGVAIR